MFWFTLAKGDRLGVSSFQASNHSQAQICLEATSKPYFGKLSPQSMFKIWLATTVTSHITTKPSNSGSKSQDVMVLSSAVLASSGANKLVSAETHLDGAHSAHSDSRYATITEPVLLSLVSPSVLYRQAQVSTSHFWWFSLGAIQ
ncbi:hypothetical protein SO802_028345 [Lithocarpus litseifolius]|uniref:Uncharacterized protein n=1 Tax=Lithocarpus litseifolius TaxID=425828 RepID=A0AAW2BS28_9ROSI